MSSTSLLNAGPGCQIVVSSRGYLTSRKLRLPLQRVIRRATELVYRDIVFKDAYPEGEDGPTQKAQYLRSQVIAAAKLERQVDIYRRAKTDATFVKPNKCYTFIFIFLLVKHKV